MREEWKNIEGYKGVYQVSNLGRVRGRNGKVLSVSVLKNLYLSVSLWKNNRGKTYTVHRLVANAFLPNSGNKKCVDHIDGNRQNNNVNNLRWATTKENANNPVSVKRYKAAALKRIVSSLTKEKHKKFMKGRVHNHRQVLCVETKVLYNSMSDAARAVGVTEAAIRRAAYDINRTSGGYHWKNILL